MDEILSGGQEKINNEYERQLGALFERKRAQYIKFATTLLLLKKVPPIETDRPELAEDLVQNVFLALLRNPNIDFSLADNQIESYVAEYLKGQVLNWISRHYRSKAKNPFKIPEKDYVTLKEADETIDPSPASNPHLLAERQELAQKLDRALKTLKPREEKILRMRHGLPPYEKEHTLKEVAEDFDVSTERIRQIEAKALRKMQHPSRTRDLGV